MWFLVKAFVGFVLVGVRKWFRAYLRFSADRPIEQNTTPLLSLKPNEVRESPNTNNFEYIHCLRELQSIIGVRKLFRVASGVHGGQDSRGPERATLLRPGPDSSSWGNTQLNGELIMFN